MNAKFTGVCYNDTKVIKTKKLMNMFCSYEYRADLKLNNKNAREGLTKSINICNLNYRNGIIQDFNEEQEKIGKMTKSLIIAFKDLE